MPAGGRHSWDAVEYEKLFLLDRSLSFTIDLSSVGCGCNAAVYLVAMDKPSSIGSNYCDIQGFDLEDMEACTELDLLEGNVKALQSTLHTAQSRRRHGGVASTP